MDVTSNASQHYIACLHMKQLKINKYWNKCYTEHQITVF